MGLEKITDKAMNGKAKTRLSSQNPAKKYIGLDILGNLY